MTFRKRSKKWSHINGIFVRMDSSGISEVLNPILTHVIIHQSDSNHPGTTHMIPRWCIIWWDSWMKNGAIKEDNRPWGDLLVLYAKPHQENVP